MRQTQVLLTMALTILTLAPAEIVQADLCAGLVAHYTFDGNANDTSGNGYSGVVHGATLTADRFGNPNSAYHFDGINDDITVANTGGAFNLTTAWTISAWCLPEASVPYGTSTPVVWKTAQNAYNFDTFGLAGQPGDTYILKLERASDDEDVAVVSPALAPGRWYYLAGTYDGRYLKLYIDGVLNQSHEVGSIIAYTGPAPLMIGSTMNTNHGDKGVFDGIIDDVSIYSRALSDAEIKELSVVPVPGAVLLGFVGLSYAAWRLRRGRL
jgi:hypothetical protein